MNESDTLVAKGGRFVIKYYYCYQCKRRHHRHSIKGDRHWLKNKTILPYRVWVEGDSSHER